MRENSTIWIASITLTLVISFFDFAFVNLLVLFNASDVKSYTSIHVSFINIDILHRNSFQYLILVIIKYTSYLPIKNST